MSVIMPTVVVTRTLREAMSAEFVPAGAAHPAKSPLTINNPIHVNLLIVFIIFSLN
jgi:hypothetical protein